ncbi:MAG TPA: AbfB domain-containing protein [Spirochaetota bacterium]|nr:AbfB domain-containing protein [Spirochaetota bacterium]
MNKLIFLLFIPVITAACSRLGFEHSCYYKIQSYNRQRYFFYYTHDNAMRLQKGENDNRERNIFKAVPGLADKDELSFEAYSKPGYYLSVSADRLVLKEKKTNAGFKSNSTFVETAGLTNDWAVSLKAFFNEKYYIRHSRYKLWVHSNDHSSVFAKDATFIPVPTTNIDQNRYSCDE